MTLVCDPCRRALGRIAGEPTSAHTTVLERMQHESIEVVSLVPDPVTVWRWQWTSQWPGIERVTGGRG